MAKINILFNNKNYNIDESSLSSASDALKQHLQTVMNGSGAVINFDRISYNVDSTKLTDATDLFVSHLGTISGSGMSVIVNGTSYAIDSTKMSDSIDYFSDILGNLNNSDDMGDEIINYKSETIVLDENSASLTIGAFSEMGYVENRRVYFYDSDCFVIVLNGTELIIDKTALTNEEGAIIVQSDVVVGQYNDIDILCTIKKNRQTGLVQITVNLAETPIESISASLIYKTVNTVS